MRKEIFAVYKRDSDDDWWELVAKNLTDVREADRILTTVAGKTKQGLMLGRNANKRRRWAKKLAPDYKS
jgi:hypothetical protein